VLRGEKLYSVLDMQDPSLVKTKLKRSQNMHRIIVVYSKVGREDKGRRMIR